MDLSPDEEHFQGRLLHQVRRYCHAKSGKIIYKMGWTAKGFLHIAHAQWHHRCRKVVILSTQAIHLYIFTYLA